MKVFLNKNEKKSTGIQNDVNILIFESSKWELSAKYSKVKIYFSDNKNFMKF